MSPTGWYIPRTIIRLPSFHKPGLVRQIIPTIFPEFGMRIGVTCKERISPRFGWVNLERNYKRLPINSGLTVWSLILALEPVGSIGHSGAGIPIQVIPAEF